MKKKINKGGLHTQKSEFNLSEVDFRQLSEAEMPSGSLEKVRDLFLFQCYTCLRHKEMMEFKATNIEDVDGQKLYRGKCGKTGEEIVIPLLPKALEILKKYENQLPIISCVNYNKYLKRVAEAAGFKKTLTSHSARHIGATTLLNAGIPMQVVCNVCGHSSTLN